MNLEELRTIQANERESSSLQPLPESFYQDVVDYLANRREERAHAAAGAEDPFSSDEVRRLTHEIETAAEVTEAIYDRRVGKVVKRASLAAAGMTADEEGLTAEEAALFEELVDRIATNRTAVLEEIKGAGTRQVGDHGGDEGPLTAMDEDGAVTPDPNPGEAQGATSAEDEPGATEPTESAARGASGTNDRQADGTHETDARGSNAAPGDEASTENVDWLDEGTDADSSPDPDDSVTDRVTVRITEDVGEIFGVDERVYTLTEEDVVTLPAANANPLLEKDAAHRIDRPSSDRNP